MINPTEVNSLIRLLDDPDAEIFGHVHEKLLSYGTEAIDYLESAFEQAFDPIQQERIANLVHEIQFGTVKNDLKLWHQSGAFDLLQGILIINRYQYPDLDEQKVINQIEAIKRDVWIQMMNEASPVEQVKLMNHVFYSIHGFSGNTTNHRDPQNSYISQVLDIKRGNQISLAIIYAIIAQKLDIPIYGVNLPQHFILAYLDESRDSEFEGGILFYINAFNKGFIFGRRDVDMFLKQLNLKFDKQFYEPCSNSDIIKRVIRNLISAYEHLGSSEKVDELNELLQIMGG
ncbi:MULTISPECIES: transglutaminase-like domain-containing protein [unclassified Mucilaginibacter]|uniref:transglutaminase-like domain-containing protein n=1 Tax=unclassified Mucilaginibacter TaxID=2617802 RepID=UPI002AC9D757|nr:MULTISPECIES: transglutaminase-like domain-containing protein [unclassified Mucilaginibacter]MEB0263521.1 transglutaminase-like domain-containing protein [Mucilaginibacter sp. 10I4]MEB0280143.1 transglutaminase-like domain-containing protein [Mucilaginibacter sp. 10B2]MEB0301653.1 transglutaminase-like domain-containing protein [Mucilaginibacter sp. 5C4]WPX24448.1 transglutaminase-like domain-containing protein [Mucilaginibacter sp. 5C4]